MTRAHVEAENGTSPPAAFYMPTYFGRSTPMALDEKLGRTRKEQVQQLGLFVGVSYVVGVLVYGLIPEKTTSVEVLTQFFAAAITVNATFLVTIAVIFSSLVKAVPITKRERWVTFSSWAVGLLLLGMVISAVVLLSFVPSFPTTSLAVTFAVVFVFGSWFFGFLVVLYEIRNLISFG